MFKALKKSLSKPVTEPVNNGVETPPELRLGDREDVFADAMIRTTIGQKKQGVVLDVSHCGARLRLVSADSLTERVQLEIPRLQLKRLARVRWRTRTDVGLEYID